jgi:hypothetical protein
MSGYAGVSAVAGYCVAGKSRSHLWAKEIKQHGAGNHEADSSVQDIASDEVDQIAQNLSSEDDDGESPSPKAAPEPAGRGERESHAEKEEENPYDSAERGELVVGSRIERPHSIQCCVRPQQRCSGESGHNGAEDEKDADGGHARSLSARVSAVVRPRVILHVRNITERAGRASIAECAENGRRER